LMGPNGSGKTTLLRTIVGDLGPLRGMIRLGHRVVINYYAQAHEGLRMNATVLEEIRRIKPLIKETEARTLLGRFLFSGDDVFKLVGDLSGGERSRVALAQLTLMGGNLLVLDEPTNHLDIGAREALEVVLNEYNGSILFVSHDRYFIDAVADTIWMVQDGTIEAFAGNYSEYAAYREAKARPEPAVERQGVKETGERRHEISRQGDKETSRPDGDSNGSRLLNGKSLSTDAHAAQGLNPKPQGSNKEQSKAERKRQRRLEALEQEIAMLEAEQKQLAEEMTSAGISGDGKRVKSLQMQYAEVSEMISSRMDEWASLAP